MEIKVPRGNYNNQYDRKYKEYQKYQPNQTEPPLNPVCKSATGNTNYTVNRKVLQEP